MGSNQAAVFMLGSVSNLIDHSARVSVVFDRRGATIVLTVNEDGREAGICLSVEQCQQVQLLLDRAVAVHQRGENMPQARAIDS